MKVKQGFDTIYQCNDTKCCWFIIRFYNSRYYFSFYIVKFIIIAVFLFCFSDSNFYKNLKGRCLPFLFIDMAYPTPLENTMKQS